MGLFSRRPKDGVPGTAHVVAATAHSGRSTHQTCRLNLVVSVQGWPAYSVEHSQICPASKWPHPGSTLAVVVSQSDPMKLKIDFDAMPDAGEVARMQAEQMAARLRGAPGHGGTVSGPFTTTHGPTTTTTVHVHGGSAADIPADLRDGIEQMLGVDIDGDGRIGGAGTAPSSGFGFGQPAGWSSPATDDRVAQLERLAALHRSGALTDAEFAAEKRRLLGG